jgi:hypothetical protein
MKMGGGGAGKVRRSSAITTLIDGIVFDADPTTYNSDNQDVSQWRNFLLFLDVASSGTPTTIRFILQFSDDGGTTYYDYLLDHFVWLGYEDQDTASGITHCYDGVCHGRDMRLRAVATGTDGSNTFTVTAKIEFYR